MGWCFTALVPSAVDGKRKESSRSSEDASDRVVLSQQRALCIQVQSPLSRLILEPAKNETIYSQFAVALNSNFHSQASASVLYFATGQELSVSRTYPGNELLARSKKAPGCFVSNTIWTASSRFKCG